MTESSLPLRKRIRRRFGCFFWSFLVLLLAFVAVLGEMAPRIEQRLQVKLAEILTEEFGRPVEVTGVSLLPLRVKRITVAGAGAIDPRPPIELHRVSGWPDLGSLLVGQGRIGSLTIDSAIIRATYRDGVGWSVQDLFPKPTSADPPIRLIRIENADIQIRVDTRTVYEESLSLNIALQPYGDMLVDARGPGKIGSFTRASANGLHPGYRVHLLIDTVPDCPFAREVRLDATIHPDTGHARFALKAALLDKPLALAAEVTESRAVYQLAGRWDYAGSSGSICGSIDRARQWLDLALLNAPLLDARLVTPRVTGGTVQVVSAGVSGPVSGPYRVAAEAELNGLSVAGDPGVENLGGKVRLRAQISSANATLTEIGELEGRITFARAWSGAQSAEKGDLGFAGSLRALRLDGRLHALGGVISSPGFTLGLSRRYAPESIHGRLALEHVDGDKMGLGTADLSVPRITASLDIDAAIQGGRIKPDALRGRIDGVDLVWRKESFRLSDGRVDVTQSDGLYHATGSGRISGLGGEGTVSAEVVKSQVRSVVADIRGVRVDRLRRLHALPVYDRYLACLKTIDVDGRLRIDESGAVTIAGMVTAPDLVLSGAGGGATPHRLVIGLDVTLAGESRPVTVRRAALEVDDGRTSLRLQKPVVFDPAAPQGVLVIESLDAGHAREIALMLRPDLTILQRLKLSGGITAGAIELNPDLNLWQIHGIEGRVRLQNAPFDFALTGGIIPRGWQPETVDLTLRITRFMPQAVYEAAAIVDSRIDGSLLRLAGTCSAELKLVGDAWDDVRLDGQLRMNNVTIESPQYKSRIVDLSGVFPFVLQRTGKWRAAGMGPDQSRPVSIGRISYGDLAMTGVKAEARFDEKTLYLEDVTFRFAGGTGKGAFVINFPGTEKPRIAFFGSADNFDVSTFYTMLPFKGKLAGRGFLRKVEFKFGVDANTSSRVEEDPFFRHVNSINAELEIESGVIGAELLKVFVQDMHAVSTKESLVKEALLDMSEWDFTTARITVRLDPYYYSESLARSKFGMDRHVRSEVIGDYKITGPVRPLGAFFIFNRKVKPFDWFPVVTTIDVQGAQMRLLMERVGRNLDTPAPSSAADTGTAPGLNSGQSSLETDEAFGEEDSDVAGEDPDAGF